VKKNRDDWKEVCASAVGIVELVKKEIECHGVVMSERLKAFGEELVRCVVFSHCALCRHLFIRVAYWKGSNKSCRN
jgi:hypothetical protein